VSHGRDAAEEVCPDRKGPGAGGVCASSQPGRGGAPMWWHGTASRPQSLALPHPWARFNRGQLVEGYVVRVLVPGERRSQEQRVAASPETVAPLLATGVRWRGGGGPRLAAGCSAPHALTPSVPACAVVPSGSARKAGASGRCGPLRASPPLPQIRWRQRRPPSGCAGLLLSASAHPSRQRAIDRCAVERRVGVSNHCPELLAPPSAAASRYPVTCSRRRPTSPGIRP